MKKTKKKNVKFISPIDSIRIVGKKSQFSCKKSHYIHLANPICTSIACLWITITIFFVTFFILIRSTCVINISTNESHQNVAVRVNRFCIAQSAELCISYNGISYGNHFIPMHAHFNHYVMNFRLAFFFSFSLNFLSFIFLFS